MIVESSEVLLVCTLRLILEVLIRRRVYLQLDLMAHMGLRITGIQHRVNIIRRCLQQDLALIQRTLKLLNLATVKLPERTQQLIQSLEHMVIRQMLQLECQLMEPILLLILEHLTPVILQLHNRNILQQAFTKHLEPLLTQLMELAIQLLTLAILIRERQHIQCQDKHQHKCLMVNLPILELNPEDIQLLQLLATHNLMLSLVFPMVDQVILSWLIIMASLVSSIFKLNLIL